MGHLPYDTKQPCEFPGCKSGKPHTLDPREGTYRLLPECPLCTANQRADEAEKDVAIFRDLSVDMKRYEEELEASLATKTEECKNHWKFIDDLWRLRSTSSTEKEKARKYIIEAAERWPTEPPG